MRIQPTCREGHGGGHGQLKPPHGLSALGQLGDPDSDWLPPSCPEQGGTPQPPPYLGGGPDASSRTARGLSHRAAGALLPGPGQTLPSRLPSALTPHFSAAKTAQDLSLKGTGPL